MKAGTLPSPRGTSTTTTRALTRANAQAPSAPASTPPPGDEATPGRGVPVRDEMARGDGAKAALRALALDVRSAPIDDEPSTKAGEAASLGARLLRFTKSDKFRKGATVAALGLSLLGCARNTVAQTVVAGSVDTNGSGGATRQVLDRPASSWVGGPAHDTNAPPARRSPQQALIEARIDANRASRADASSPASFDPSSVRFEAPADATRVAVPLTRGVGVGQPNREADVRAVQQRLVDLGFPIEVDGDMGPSTQRALRTFTALVEGKEVARRATPHITPGSDLHQALERADLPRWMEMPASGVGFENIDADNHDYGWSVLADVVHGAGQRYYDEYQCLNPDSSAILTNDASLRLGGDTRDHASHETGLDLDVRLPNRLAVGQPTRVGRASYDRDAARAQVKAFIAEPAVERVLIGDATLVRELQRSGDENAHKVEDGGASHRDHIHVDVSFPELKLG